MVETMLWLSLHSQGRKWKMGLGDIHGSEMTFKSRAGITTAFELVRSGTMKELGILQEAHETKKTELVIRGQELKAVQTKLAEREDWSAEQTELYEKMKHDLAEEKKVSAQLRKDHGALLEVSSEQLKNAREVHADAHVVLTAALAKERESVKKLQDDRVASSKLLLSLLGGFKNNGTMLDQILASAEKDLEGDDHSEDVLPDLVLLGGAHIDR